MAEFQARTTMPNKKNQAPTNKWYSNYSANTGGYYGVTQSGCPYGNCTWYCYRRIGEILGEYNTKFSGLGNGGQWYANAKARGLSVGQEPKLGAVMCWAGSGAGHVAIVEWIDDSKNVKASMSAAGSHGFWFSYGGYATKSATSMFTTVSATSMFTKASNYNYPLNGYKFQGFIYLPGLEDGSTITTTIDWAKRIAKLSSSDNYEFISAEEEINDKVKKTESIKLLQSLGDSLKRGTISAVTDKIYQAAQLQDVLEQVSTRAELNAQHRNIVKKQSALDLSNNVIEAPFIEVEINGVKIGCYNGDLDTYPNYVDKLTVTKQNGTINNYIIELSHQIRFGDDSNLLDELLSYSNYDKIRIKYGDAYTKRYYYDYNVQIVNVSSNARNYSSAKITYTIEAVSEGAVIKTTTFDFPSTTDRPSNVIRDLLYNNNQTSQVLLENFPGMQNQTFVETNTLLPTNDAIVNITAKSGANLLDYINYLVGLMSNSADTSTLKSSSYYMNYIDDTTNGAYMQVVELSNDINPTGVADKIYNITVGYESDIVYSFDVDTTNSWELLYKHNTSASNAYYYSIQNNGDVSKYYTPSIMSTTKQMSAIDQNWWTNMVNFPITASLTIKGLLTPILLTDYININVVFYGAKHITSGVYAITGQKDNLSSSGFTTTLSLVRVKDSV